MPFKGDSSNKEEIGEPSYVIQVINNILVMIRGRILLKRAGNDENQETSSTDPFHVAVGPITKGQEDQ